MQDLEMFRSDRCGIVTHCCTVNQWRVALQKKWRTKTNCCWCASRLLLHAPPLCPPGERQPVSRSQRGAPEAACTSLQLPGGGGSHQPGHDPRHAGHEPAKGWFSTAALVRMINRCLMTFCCLVANGGVLACFAVLRRTLWSPDPCSRSSRRWSTSCRTDSSSWRR